MLIATCRADPDYAECAVGILLEPDHLADGG
jgi:hypothetical protein